MMDSDCVIVINYLLYFPNNQSPCIFWNFYHETIKILSEHTRKVPKANKLKNYSLKF